MKKNLLKMVLCLCMVTAAMCGCGSGTKATLEDDTVVLTEDETTEEPVEDPEEEIPEEPDEETPEEPEEEPAKDWFEEQGLVITPQGDFTYTAVALNSNMEEVGTLEVVADAVITETTDGVEEGYKEVTIVWNEDASAVYDVEGARAVSYFTSAFDRYTGISFRFDLSATYTRPGQTNGREGFVTIVNGDDSYDVSVSTVSTSNYPKLTVTITVTCPVDYDGVVFYIGPAYKEMDETAASLDLTAGLYTIDELPYYGDEYYYFSYSNE